MQRGWVLAIVMLASCDRFLQLTKVDPYPVGDGSGSSDGTDAPIGCARSIAAGRMHTCMANHTGDVYCWGFNTNGESNPGGPPYVLAPYPIVLPGHAIQVTTGYEL